MNSQFILSCNELSGFPYTDTCNLCGVKTHLNIQEIFAEAEKNGVSLFNSNCGSIICKSLRDMNNIEERSSLCFSDTFNQSSALAYRGLFQSGQIQNDTLQPFDHRRVHQESLAYHHASLSWLHRAPIEEAYLHNKLHQNEVQDCQNTHHLHQFDHMQVFGHLVHPEAFPMSLSE